MITHRILIVDDDANLLEAIQRGLRKQFSIDTAVGGLEGLRKLGSDGPYDVVVSDMRMPEMTGLEFLKQVQVRAPETVRLMLTGNSDQKTAMDAVNDGRVFRFLTKPCPPPTLVPALEAALEHARLVRTERELLENTLGGAVKVLTEILAHFDPETFERTEKLKDYVVEFLLSSNDESSWELELAAALSQIGRVTVPTEILEKVRRNLALTTAEQEVLGQVPEFGARLLQNIPRLESVVNLVRYQQKNFDGTGAPADAAAGNALPIGARILKVLRDLLDLEKREISRAEALVEMQTRRGFYDPHVLAAVSRWCDVALVETTGRRAEPQEMRLSELRVGDVIAHGLRTADGILLVAAETRLTAVLLARLRNFRALKLLENTVFAYRTP